MKKRKNTKRKLNGFQLKQQRQSKIQNKLKDMSVSDVLETINNSQGGLFQNTNRIKWDILKKGHITLQLIGVDDEVNSQEVRFNPSGTPPKLVIDNTIYDMNWNKRSNDEGEYPYKDKETPKTDVINIHIPFDKISCIDDIYKLTNTGDYSHLHEWNSKGEYQRILPVLWLKEKTEFDNFRNWNTYTHSLESVKVMKLFGEYQIDEDPNFYYEYLKSTSNIIVCDVDDDLYVVHNPKNNSTKVLSKSLQDHQIPTDNISGFTTFRKLRELHELGIPIDQVFGMGFDPTEMEMN